MTQKTSFPKTITITFLITLITRFELALSLFNNYTDIVNKTNMEHSASLINSNPTLYWVLQFVITAVIFFVVYQIFIRIYRLESQLINNTIASQELQSELNIQSQSSQELQSELKVQYIASQELQSQLKIQSIISDIRNLNTFKELYKNHEFYLLPNEDMKSYLSRSHSGIYAEKIVEEIKEVRERAINQMSDKTIKEIDKLIIKSYNLKRKK